jgi:xanthine/uracil permease
MDTTAHRRDAGDRTIAGLFGDLWRQTSTLVHEEVELAKAEMTAKVSQVGSGVASIGAGGAILFAGFIILLLAAVGALGMVLPPEHAVWLSPLIVGAVVMIIGFMVLSRGRREIATRNLKPERTIGSLRRDAQLAKEHMQ